MSISYAPEKIKKIVGFGAILLLLPVLVIGVLKIRAEMANKRDISLIYPKNSELAAASFVAFGNPEVLAEKTAKAIDAAKAAKAAALNQTVVASKKGTKYYLLSCSGAKTILAENKIIFPNLKAAEKAGYTPAKNCKGLNTTSE